LIEPGNSFFLFFANQTAIVKRNEKQNEGKDRRSSKNISPDHQAHFNISLSEEGVLVNEFSFDGERGFA